MARAWVSKIEALKAVKSTRCQAWLSSFNYWVPGVVQNPSKQKQLKPGNVFMEFRPPRPAPMFRLQIPAVAIRIEHKEFTHSVPFLRLAKLLSLLGSDGS